MTKCKICKKTISKEDCREYDGKSYHFICFLKNYKEIVMFEKNEIQKP